MKGSDWQTTAWNGVVLHHPATWEVTRLDRDQLLWSDERAAALEVRWHMHKGRYEPGRVFKRFARQARRKKLPHPEPWRVPDAWRAALARFELAGFMWRQSGDEGCGLLAYCHHCRRLSLIQIHPVLAARPQLIPHLLASFQDHPENEALHLHLFGIRARLPLGSHLGHFRFETGHYRLIWRKNKCRIGLFRWAPAGVVLGRQSLKAFGSDFFQLAPRDTGLGPSVHHGFKAVGGALSRNLWPRALSDGLAPLLKQRLVRVWHDSAHNCLLGVEVRGRGRETSPMFDRICDQFEAYST